MAAALARFLLAGEQNCKLFGIFSAALEARPMTCRERRNLVEKKQFRIAIAPDVAMPVLELEPTADPGPVDPTARCAAARRDYPSRYLGLATCSPNGDTRFGSGISSSK
jgi:hypothetical protein